MLKTIAALALLAITTGQSFLFGQTLFEFGTENIPLVLHRPEENDHSARIGTMPDGSKALCFTWNRARKWFYEFAIKDSLELTEFDAAQIRLKLYIPVNNSAKNIKIRLRDRDGEILQYKAIIEPGVSGWQDFAFNLQRDKESNDGAWGGGKKANQRLDLPASLIGFASEYQIGEGSGWIGYGKVTFDTLNAPPELVLETGSGSPMYVLAPGDEKQLALQIVNRRPADSSCSVSYQIRDYQGQKLFDNTANVQLKKSGTVYLPIPKPTSFGIYYIDYSIAERDKPDAAVNKRIRYCYMKPAGPTPFGARGFLFGMCVHSQRYPLNIQEREALAAAWCGVKITRQDLVWNKAAPLPGVWDFSNYDQLVDVYGKNGIELQALWAYAPRWIGDKFQKNGAPEEWAELIRQSVKHYRGKIKYYEVWNEPDHSGTQKYLPIPIYTELQKIAYTEAKKIDPSVEIMNGGFAGMVSNQEQESVVTILSQIKGYSDLVAFHGHGSLGGYMPQISKLTAEMNRQNMQIPWYANESGIPSNWSDEMEQARTLYKKILYSWAKGAIGYNWYDLRNDGNDPQYIEHNFGLLTHDFYPKAGYPVYAMLANHFQEARYLNELHLGNMQQGYVFQAKDGSYLFPCWSNAGPEQLICIRNITGVPTVIDLFGNKQLLSVWQGAAVLKVGSQPATLHIETQKNLPELRGSFFLPEDMVISPGKTNDCLIEFSNPLAGDITFQLSPKLPDGLMEHGYPKQVRIKPGEKRKVTFQIQADKKLSSRTNPLLSLNTQVQIKTDNGSVLWNGVVQNAIRTALPLPEHGLSDESNFVLDNKNQVTLTVPTAPSNEPLYWQGPEDLSANIWLGRDENNLIVKINVTDDIHVQPFTGGAVWKGDNIQVAMQFEGQNKIWEIGLTRLANGKPEVFVWMNPDGFDDNKIAQHAILETDRDEQRKITVYNARIPLQELGVSQQILQRGFRFNVLVNDNDGSVRENYICIAPGIADTKSSAQYPYVIFGK